ncbi:hypothetical protein [Sorangium sp. So ce131]|uniref:hypothetical protein n=1 Tax=Sorangium sp. So ce131 TaxID=3133282 RepID=UPI003F5F6F29
MPLAPLASLVHEELWIAALDTHGRVRETRLLARAFSARFHQAKRPRLPEDA